MFRKVRGFSIRSSTPCSIYYFLSIYSKFPVIIILYAFLYNYYFSFKLIAFKAYNPFKYGISKSDIINYML